MRRFARRNLPAMMFLLVFVSCDFGRSGYNYPECPPGCWYDEYGRVVCPY